MMQVSAGYAIGPVIDAALNGTSAVLPRAHGRAPRADVTTLISSSTITHMSARYIFRDKAGRPVYFSILISHTILAMAIVTLVIITLSRALREHFARHRKIARWTFPL
jgi:uncharacterized membrane protein YozB (DUF420 family)